MAVFPLAEAIAADRLTVSSTAAHAEGSAHSARRRKVAAAAIDGALIIGPTVAAVAWLHERFTVLPTPDGSPRFSSAQQLRINEIDQVFNRGIRLGDTVLTLSGGGWWLTMAILVMTTTVVVVTVPALDRGNRRTPGRLLLGPAPAMTARGVAEIGSIAHIDVTPPEPQSDLDSEPESESQPSPAKPDSDAQTESAARVESGTDDDQSDHSDPDEIRLGPVPTEIDLAEGEERPEPVDVRQPVPTQVTLADAGDYLDWDRWFSAGTATMVRPKIEPASATANETEVTTSNPTWSAEWNAWMHWEPAQSRWFRHDPSTNRWTPVS